MIVSQLDLGVLAEENAKMLSRLNREVGKQGAGNIRVKAAPPVNRKALTPVERDVEIAMLIDTGMAADVARTLVMEGPHALARRKSRGELRSCPFAHPPGQKCPRSKR